MSMIWLSQVLIPEKSSKILYNELKKCVERHIISEILKNGFLQSPHPFYERPSQREKSYNPHGIFRKINKNYDELIQIVYDDRKFPQFHLEFGIAPNKGVNIRGKYFESKNISVSESPVQFTLSSSSILFKPFVVMWPFEGLKDIPKIVGEANMLMNQVFNWFYDGSIGSNIFGGTESDVIEISDYCI